MIVRCILYNPNFKGNTMKTLNTANTMGKSELARLRDDFTADNGFDAETGAMINRIESAIIQNHGEFASLYFHKFGADFFRIYGLALDYADRRNTNGDDIPVNVALGYTLHRLKLLRHGLHATKATALDKLEELQGGNFSNRNLRVHDDIANHENTIEYDSINEINNNLNVQALLKNLFFDYTYARRVKIINTMFSNFTEQKKILSKDQLYKMSRRLEKITGAKSRIKPELLAVIFERNIEFIGSLV